MATYGIQMCDAGVEAAALQGNDPQLAMPPAGSGPLGWMGLVYHDGQQFAYGRPAEDCWFVHPRQVCHHFLGRLSRETSSLLVGGKSPSYSQLAFYFLRDLHEKLTASAPMEKVALAVPGAYLKDAATEDERIGLLLGMAAELKLPLVGIVDMAVAALCDPRLDYYDPILPVLVVDVHLHGSELTLVRPDAGRPVRKDFAYLPQLGYAELLRQVTTAMGNRFLRHTAFDILEDGRIEQEFYRQCKAFLLSRAAEQHFQLNTASRNYELMATREQLTADTAGMVQALVLAGQSLLQKAGGRPEPCTVALTERASLLPGLAARFRAAGQPRVLRLAAGAAAAGAAWIAARREVSADLSEVPVDTVAPFSPERRTQRAPLTLRVVKARPASGIPAPTHLVCEGLGHTLNGHGAFTIGARGLSVDLPLPEDFTLAGSSALVRLDRDAGRWWLTGADDETDLGGRTSLETGDRLLVRFGEAEAEMLFVHCPPAGARGA